MSDAAAGTHERVLAQHRSHTCPWWLGWTLANPVRRWVDNPDALLGDLVQASDRVLEIGPGLGFYTVPMARRVGPTGKVVCVDIQQRMLEGLQRRLDRRGLGDRIDTRCCAADNRWVSELQGTIDKAVLIYVLHEVSDPRQTLAEVHQVMRPGGKLLIVEPRGHCPAELFAAELWAARQVGFTDVSDELRGKLARRQAALLRR